MPSRRPAVDLCGRSDHIQPKVDHWRIEEAARLAICRTNACGFYRQGDRCGHSGCGCYLEVKTGWADQSCPLDSPRWGTVESQAR